LAAFCLPWQSALWLNNMALRWDRRGLLQPFDNLLIIPHGCLIVRVRKACGYQPVSFDDGTGVRHSVQVSAETAFEAAALALHVFEDAGTSPGPAAHLEIAAQTPVAVHSVSVQRVRDWLTSGGKTPKEQALKSRLRDLI
jgi:hypothetical protein